MRIGTRKGVARQATAPVCTIEEVFVNANVQRVPGWPFARLGTAAALAVLSAVTVAPSARADGAVAAHAVRAEGGEADLPTSGTLRRSRVVEAVLRRHPAIAAARERALAAREEADADASLPGPQVSLDVWQVPIARPYAVGDAQMVMAGLKQRFPAPGVLSARADRTRAEAKVLDVDTEVMARDLAREAGHAFVDHAEAHALHVLHDRHLALAERVRAVAEARYQAAGSLVDATSADALVAATEADRAGDTAAFEATRAQLNALLLRPLDAPLASPELEPPARAAWDQAKLAAEAEARRPELRAARAEEEVASLEHRARAREAAIPELSVAALYFAPVGPMREHGIGAQVMADLPWLWGGARTRVAAQDRRRTAAASERRARGVKVRAEVAEARARLEAAASRLGILERRLIPARARAAEVTLAGYEAGQSSLLAYLTARHEWVESETDRIRAHAALEHAFVDLEWAAGIAVPRAPLSEPLGKGGE